MSSIKFNFDRMRVATLRKQAAGASGFSSTGLGGMGGSGFNGFGGGGGGRGNSHNRFNPVYDDLSEGTIVEQFMPTDVRRLHRIWRRIYYQDPVAGPAVELYKDLPWSDFQLIGVDDQTIAQLYSDCLNAINITSRLPELSAEFLTMGKVIGHMLFDESKGFFNRMIIHDPDWIRVSEIPLGGFQPKLDLIPTPGMRAFASSKDPRDIEAQEQVPELVQMIRNGQEIPLAPEHTFYIPRRYAPYDVMGASAYTRIIMFVAYEKALVNATVASARRRASRIRHVTAGIDDVWEPSAEELGSISDLFMQADEDPVGAIVVTRTGVQVNEVGGSSPQDIVKISDEWQFLLQGKLNALGVSEAFLTGEATYNTLEQLMSVFLEKVKAHRNFFVHNLIKEKILKPLAIKHNFIRRKKAEVDHRIRIAQDVNERDYIIPTLAWAKSLRPVADRDYLEILGMMEEKGIPVTLRTWSSAAGFDLDSEMDQFPNDVEARRQMSQQKKKVTAVAPEMAQQGAGGGLGGDDALGGLGGDLGGLGGGGGMDMGGLGGGMDMGGMGGAGGDMGGGLGGAGGDAGAGGAGGGAGGGLALPAVGASFRGASAISAPDEVPDSSREFAAILRNLPFWDRKGQFMGLGLDQAELTMWRLLDFAGTKTARTMTKGDTNRLLRTGNHRRDDVLKFVLSRVGVLRNAAISREVGIDIQEKLSATLGGHPDKLAVELRAVAACVATGLRDSKPAILERPENAKLRKASAMQKGLVSRSESAGTSLLTGYVDDPKQLKDE
jgi:hypothetical protein